MYSLVFNSIDSPTGFILHLVYFVQDLENEKLTRIAAQKSEAQTLLQYQLIKVESDRVKQQLKDVQCQ